LSQATTTRPFNGYLRADGRAGIRNLVTVVYTVECAHHVAREIAGGFGSDVQVIGFGGCYPSAYATTMLERLTTHPNVGAVLIVSLGCEGFDRDRLQATVESSGRPVGTVVIQAAGGTRRAVEAGRAWVSRARRDAQHVERVAVGLADLVVGTICGGSDTTSGITANPVVGRAFDIIVDAGGTAIFEETGELIGCEIAMAARAATSALGAALVSSVQKAERYYRAMGHGSFAAGNAEGGLTTIEEKSLGAYAKSGSRPISGILRPGERAQEPGLYLLDIVPEGEVRWGYPNINDNAEIAELISCGAHLVLFTTGRGSVVGSAVAPVIKICANPDTYARMAEDMDVNAGKILEHQANADEVGAEIVEQVLATSAGEPTKSEELGHCEFVLTYKSFEPAGPSCLATPS